MRSLVALVGITVGTVLFVPADATARAAPPVRLSVTAHTGAITSVLVPTAATLECDGRARGSGYLARAAPAACALVREGTLAKVADAHRHPRLCADGYGGPQRARIKGTVGRRRVAVAINRSDGCGIDEWTQLLALLGEPERTGAIPRRHTLASTTTTTAPASTYQVKRGDTLTEIAKRFRTSVAAIITTNHLADADHLTEGQPLVMPPPTAVRIDAALVDDQGTPAMALALVGAQPTEQVTFVVTRPDGSTYTGTPHAASDVGTVTTNYTGDLPAGGYRVDASGTAGTTAALAFHIVPPD